MTSPMPPEPTPTEWRRAEAEYAAREHERHAATIEAVLDTHRWPGGYFCDCGRALNSADAWGRHVLWAALEPDPDADG
jgi:hypothetical protein